jgi:two-component system response regulator AtoC
LLDILLIDDEPDLRDTLEEELREAGHNVQAAGDGGEGLDRLLRHVFDVVICDVRLPRMDGRALLRHVRKETPSTDVILMTAYADVSQAVSALKDGAYDYLTKPFDVDELLVQLRRIDETRTLKRQLEKARTELAGRKSDSMLIGESPAIRRVVEVSRMVAQSDAPALITGDSGTGKEVVARMIHEWSPRSNKPFVAMNCGAMAENLIEAELFGHERGAFTGAVKKRDGRFKAADGGVLFLDEIAELPAAAQAKLLRVLQEGTFEPLGTNVSVRVDVRIISATHRNLPERIRAGLFREDLYYRINVIEIPIPPLRERPGDLPLLLRHFIQKFTPAGAAVPGVSPAAWASLLHHDFPGNVRELSHAVEHAMVLSGGKDIDLAHLPQGIAGAQTTNGGRGAIHAGPFPIDPGTDEVVRPLHLALREFEHQYLQRALKAGDGKRNRTAAMLGISRKTLWEKLRGTPLDSGDDAPEDTNPGSQLRSDQSADNDRGDENQGPGGPAGRSQTPS